jgi:hypothetical protein
MNNGHRLHHYNHHASNTRKIQLFIQHIDVQEVGSCDVFIIMVF